MNFSCETLAEKFISFVCLFTRLFGQTGSHKSITSLVCSMDVHFNDLSDDFVLPSCD